SLSMPSHWRNRSPEASFHGMPVSCTLRPGAWPTMSTRALRAARTTGRGSCGSSGAHRRQARASASTRRSPPVLPGRVACRVKLAPPSSPSLPFRLLAMPLSPLTALSPLDGRYHSALEPLRPYYSELGLIRHRVHVEIEWLLALAAEPRIAEVGPFSEASIAQLRALSADFDERDGKRVKAIERETNHDVKAIEYW